MDNETEQPVAEIAGVWGMFELRVAALVSTLGEGGSFSLHVPCNDGSVDEFTIACGSVCATVSIGSDGWGSTALEFGEGDPDDLVGRGFAIGEVLVEIFREDCGLSHPSLLTASAPIGLRDRIAILGLTKRSAVADDHVEVDPWVGVAWVDGYDDLRTVVLEHLREHHDAEVEADDDGDFPIKVSGVRLWVRVDDDQPAIRFVAPAVSGVRSRQQTDTELNVANRRSRWVRWSRRKQTVWQELTMPAYPFVPRQFDEMLRVFVRACVETRPDLADRLYGQEAR